MPVAEGIALGQNLDGRLELVITVNVTGSADSDGAVWHLREDHEWPPQWRSMDIPGEIGFGGPAIARNRDGRLEVAVTTRDALLHGWQTKPNGDEWNHDSLDRPPDQLMTRVGPALAENKDGRLEAFVLVSSFPSMVQGHLYNIRQDPTAPSGWSPWLELGDPGVPIRHRPAVAPNHDGRLEVFVQGNPQGGAPVDLEGNPGTVYGVRQDPTAPDGWSGWAELESPQVPLLGQPVVARDNDGRLEVFMLGLDGAVWHIRQVPRRTSGWSPWTSLEGQGGPFSGLAAGAHADGRLVVFAVAKPSDSASPQANTIWQREHAPAGGGWSPWRSFTRPDGSPTVMGPALALDANKQLQLWLRIKGSARLHQLKQTAPNGTEWNQREWDFTSPPSMADKPEPAGGPPA